MTDFLLHSQMSRPFGTLSSRVIPDPTLRNLTVSCMGLLRFSIFDAVEKSVKYSIRAYYFQYFYGNFYLSLSNTNCTNVTN